MRRLQHVLPYESGYTEHREIERCRRETREWLRQREDHVDEQQGSSPYDKDTHELGPGEP